MPPIFLTFFFSQLLMCNLLYLVHNKIKNYVYNSCESDFFIQFFFNNSIIREKDLNYGIIC